MSNFDNDGSKLVDFVSFGCNEINLLVEVRKRAQLQMRHAPNNIGELKGKRRRCNCVCGFGVTITAPRTIV